MQVSATVFLFRNCRFESVLKIAEWIFYFSRTAIPEQRIFYPGGHPKDIAGKQGHRGATELSTPPLCSIFYVDSENDNESLPGPIFSKKNQVFVKNALISWKNMFFRIFRVDWKFSKTARVRGRSPRVAGGSGGAQPPRAGRPGGRQPPRQDPEGTHTDTNVKVLFWFLFLLNRTSLN